MDELGRGATGVVYRAQDPAIGRTIAIKTIRLSDFTDETERERLRERLFREAQSAGMLSHPNIVTIYDIAEENGLAYIFMECVDGPPLEKVLNTQDPPLRGEVALTILRQTATALDYAHKKGIVHRDIKPANILIHDRTHAKITDFGVAKIMSQQMTQSGVMMGTPNYMSPEQVQGHSVDGRADQFSLAVIAYEILTGEKPFLADQLPALLFRIVREDPVAPQRLNPTLGPQVEMVLKKALAKSANDRYGTCMEFVDALAGALQLSPGMASASEEQRAKHADVRGPGGGDSRWSQAGRWETDRWGRGAAHRASRDPPGGNVPYARRGSRASQPFAQDPGLAAGGHWFDGTGAVRRPEVFVQSQRGARAGHRRRNAHRRALRQTAGWTIHPSQARWVNHRRRQSPRMPQASKLPRPTNRPKLRLPRHQEPDTSTGPRMTNLRQRERDRNAHAERGAAVTSAGYPPQAGLPAERSVFD